MWGGPAEGRDPLRGYPLRERPHRGDTPWGRDPLRGDTTNTSALEADAPLEKPLRPGASPLAPGGGTEEEEMGDTLLQKT